MTPERRKAIIFLSITFILGVLIGTMIPGLYGRMRHGGFRQGNHMERRDGKPTDRKTRFEHMMFKVIKPDSAQAKELRQILAETSGKIEVLQSKSNTRMSEIMDSMKVRIQPILTEEQRKRFDEFSERARARRRGNSER